MAQEDPGQNELGKAMFRQYGVRAQYHPTPTPTVTSTPKKRLPLSRRHDGEFVNLCLDTVTSPTAGGDNIAIIRRAPERIGYLHLKRSIRNAAKVEAEDCRSVRPSSSAR